MEAVSDNASPGTKDVSSGTAKRGQAGQSVVLERDADLAILRLGLPDERVIILTESRMESLANAIAEVAKDPSFKGLVLIGAGPGLFCAGADINVIHGVTDPAHGKKLARRGQEIFDSLEALKIPTVAAISGACVGGGCELVLACKHRVLTDTPQTRIGLPEVKLGILPGFGGTQRLPRLIGLPKALDVILKGQVMAATKAFELGLADKLIVPKSQTTDPDELFEQLEKAACDLARGKISVQRKGISVFDWLLTFTPARQVAFTKASEAVRKETKGFYPAPQKAIDTAVLGLKSGTKTGLEAEAVALGELIITSESKSLVHLYFLTEEASKLGKSVKVDPRSTSVAVVGGGTMGAGIAGSFLASGSKVTLVDPSEEARRKARSHIEVALGKRFKSNVGKIQEAIGRMSVTEHLESISDSAFVIEAIIENVEVKKDILRKISSLTSSKTVIASNTSSLSVTDLSAAVDNHGRVIGMHFFNPVEKMPLVELVRGKDTNERTLAFTAALTSILGKYPVVVEDVHGFLVNRILSAYLVEAAHLLAEGVKIDEIDGAIKKFGMPMGPVRLLDEIGLDIAAKVAEKMAQTYGQRMAGPQHAQKLVEAGRLGRKNGKGFYQYEGKDETVDTAVYGLLERAEPTTNGDSQPTGGSGDVLDRLLLALVNEAVRCLDEGVAGAPGKEACGQVDLASVMGFGFPPFRGGVLYYTEKRGLKEIDRRLSELSGKYGERFKPAEGIRSRAEKGKSLYA